MVTKCLIIALFVVALVEGIVIYAQRYEIWRLKDKLFDMSGLEPVLWEDAEWESQ